MRPLRELFEAPRKLSELDEFYRNTVSNLPSSARRQYCVNLLGRLKEDARKSQCPVQGRNLRLNIKAATREMKFLGDA